MCKDKSCTGPGTEETLTGATAMGLLPYLAAGQTHVTNGPFQKNISAGIYWLIAHQKANGDLSITGVDKKDQPQPHCWMYSHGLATIALCECYGMSGDKNGGWPGADRRSTLFSRHKTRTRAAGGIRRAMKGIRRSSAGS